MRYDTLVIGAGMSGLAAALRLATYDQRVRVLERHNLWGGLNSFYTLAGRRFDVGLHALTNCVPPRTKGAPLTRLLRQLRIRHEELRLRPQGHSEILLPGLRLTFTNDPAHLEAQIAAAFPDQVTGYRALVDEVRALDLTLEELPVLPAREVLRRHLSDPALVEALLMPVTYYCSAREHDVEWTQFVILFRSMFLEGLGHPEGGIRTIVNRLVKGAKAAGAELSLGCGVERIHVDGGAVRGVRLDDGTELEADVVLSSAGWVETMELCGPEARAEHVAPAEVGRMSFLETISVLDRPLSELGLDAATGFYGLDPTFRYAVPEDLVDVRSGVVSVPGNFHLDEPPAEGVVRLTVQARSEAWSALPEEEYVRRKKECANAAIEAATAYLPDWRPHTVFRDVFTPRTIRHFTGHVNGAIYGSPTKRRDGVTPYAGLYLTGTDQGYLGIVGALISGVAMANRHALVRSAS